ncbi:MAG: sugar ABC transporter permease [Chloroflexi bacterium]|jgi:alpha-glucoside transport system permease protein|nr:sugar ABC transporter permease [Chloroflexota bacterium]
MQPIADEKIRPGGFFEWLTLAFGRILVSLVVPVVTFTVLILGFRWLRDTVPSGLAEKTTVSLVAILWGVGGAGILYLISNWLIEKLSPVWVKRLQPFIFVGPAIAILTWYLALPTFRSLWISLFDRSGPTEVPFGLLFTAPKEYFAQLSTNFIGLGNYISVFTERTMITAFRNNLLWIIFGASLAIVFGLLVAVLADRSRFENIAKSLIFLPMAISMVGAGVIWNFMYEVKDIADPQIGLLNAIWVAFGNKPQAWTALITQPWNNIFLIIIMIWLQTGYAMVIFSAAIKGIPDELIEAARVDGATEPQIFFRIMIPYIMGTIITVSTTVVIFTLKIFDIVMVMTGGQFSTHVIATQFYRQAFTSNNKGLAAAIAIVLLITVIPVMIYNLRQFAEEEAF